MFTSTFKIDNEDIPFYRCSTLVKLEIWQTLDFWYAIVFEASYEEISNLPLGDME